MGLKDKDHFSNHEPKTIKSICLSCFALLLILYPSEIDALSHEWVAVPKSHNGY